MAERNLRSGQIIIMNLGDSVKGYYLDSRDDVGKFSTSIHQFSAYEDFEALVQKEGAEKGVTEKITIKKGDQFGMWGATVLDDILSRLASGQYCRVVFSKTTPSDKGNPAKIFDVFTDDEIPNLVSAKETVSTPVTSSEKAVSEQAPLKKDDLPF